MTWDQTRLLATRKSWSWELARLFQILRKRAGDLDFEDHTRMLDLDNRHCGH